MTADVMLDQRAMFLLLRDLKRVEDEIAQQEAWMQAVAAQVAEEQAARAEHAQSLRDEVERFAADMRRDSEHVDVPGMGRVQFTTRKATVKVADHAEAIKWCDATERPDFIRMKRELDVTMFKEFATAVLETEGGELLPGIERVPETTSMSIRWEKAR